MDEVKYGARNLCGCTDRSVVVEQKDGWMDRMMDRWIDGNMLGLQNSHKDRQINR